MDANTITVSSSLIECLGIGAFIYHLIRGVNTRITALESTISVQKETIKAMETHVSEVKKISETYANFAKDIPKYLDDYETIVRATKDRAIGHLESEVLFYEKKLEKYESILLNSDTNL